jgi:UDP-3-O-[3-hydroxymyristoyl] glucosamine N-acyltransferase
MKDIYSIEDFLQTCTEIQNFAKIQTTIPNSIVYIGVERLIYQAMNNKNIIAIITTKEIIKKHYNTLKSKYIISSQNPSKDFYEHYHIWLKTNTNIVKSNISDLAKISPSAIISATNVVIEDDVKIGENAVVLDGVTLKKGSVIGPNCTIGYEGFEFMKIDGKNCPMKHNGRVIIEENVELQANSVVEKGIYGEDTIIVAYTKIDNQVLIGHNVQIGKNNLITAGVVIGGSARIGDNVFIGLGSNISNRVKVGNNVTINIGSTVVSNVKDDKTISGYFAVEHNDFLRERVMMMKMLKKGKK